MVVDILVVHLQQVGMQDAEGRLVAQRIHLGCIHILEEVLPLEEGNLHDELRVSLQPPQRSKISHPRQRLPSPCRHNKRCKGRLELCNIKSNKLQQHFLPCYVLHYYNLYKSGKYKWECSVCCGGCMLALHKLFQRCKLWQLACSKSWSMAYSNS